MSSSSGSSSSKKIKYSAVESTAAVDAVRQSFKNDAEAALANAPAAIARIQSCLHDKFQFQSAVPAAAAFTEEIEKNWGGSNATLNEIIGMVRDEIEHAIDFLTTQEGYVRIMVPKMADGNNFGVDVQLAVLKEITEASQWLTQQASELPQYHEHRANAFEKCAVRKTTEKMISSGNRQQKGGKEGEQTHEHTTTDNKEIIQETECKLPDLRDFIADIDVKWYFKLRNICRHTIILYSCICDVVGKNMDKITKPRGNEGQGMSMY